MGSSVFPLLVFFAGFGGDIGILDSRLATLPWPNHGSTRTSLAPAAPTPTLPSSHHTPWSYKWLGGQTRHSFACNTKAGRPPLEVSATRTSSKLAAGGLRYGDTLLVRHMLRQPVFQGLVLLSLWGCPANIHDTVESGCVGFTATPDSSLSPTFQPGKRCTTASQTRPGKGGASQCHPHRERGRQVCQDGGLDWSGLGPTSRGMASTECDEPATTTCTTGPADCASGSNVQWQHFAGQGRSTAIGRGDGPKQRQAARTRQGAPGDTPDAGDGRGGQGPSQGGHSAAEGQKGARENSCGASKLSGGMEYLPRPDPKHAAATAGRSTEGLKHPGCRRVAVDLELGSGLVILEGEGRRVCRSGSHGYRRRSNCRGSGRSSRCQGGQPIASGARAPEAERDAPGFSQELARSRYNCTCQGCIGCSHRRTRQGKDAEEEASAHGGSRCFRRRASQDPGTAPWQSPRLDTSQWTPTLGLTHTVTLEDDCVHAGHAMLLGLALQYEVSRDFEVQLISDPRTLEVDDTPNPFFGAFFPPKASSPNKGSGFCSGCICPSSLASRSASSRTPRLVRFAEVQRGHDEAATAGAQPPHLQVLRSLKRCQVPLGPPYWAPALPPAMHATCEGGSKSSFADEPESGNLGRLHTLVPNRKVIMPACARGPGAARYRHAHGACNIHEGFVNGTDASPAPPGTEATCEATQGPASPEGEGAHTVTGDFAWVAPEVFLTQVPLADRTTAAWLSVATPVPLSLMEAQVAEAAQEEAYAFFDTTDHLRLRSMQSTWDFQQILQDAVRASNDGPITSVTEAFPPFNSSLGPHTSHPAGHRSLSI